MAAESLGTAVAQPHDARTRPDLEGCVRGRVTFVVVAASLICGTASADPVAAGDIVRLSLYGSNGTALARFADGGPFRMDLAGTAFDFLTFCLERDEHFIPNENLLVGSVTESAQNGGVNTNSGDRISGTTAFIYTMFRMGTIGYTNGVLLQEAIWHLEGERTASAAVQAFVQAAAADMVRWDWGANYLGGVQVANMYRGANYTTFAQDMLVITRVPEPASVLMLGLGLLLASRGMKRRTSPRG
jgi:hypothetical protein